ncbi:hypothetical protein PRIPAC_83590 [Pristionchus pacificus]|uniref:F-box domain-containing protein n=1 Tax=Pristionchus pacificus TaxID=54126 RepID=A0A454XPS7_PRIPA|nr:hypothetical protein PRIPAC_83590 [Pristionchus pacificus]|eukprot:PDM68747.1 hypothetical protein PRIPAC_47049 [Pristionchus pacificus]
MDILALPDVFKQKLMRKMKIKDRLRMRLTCRAFEKLVADSHAGYFQDGFLSTKYPDDPKDSTLRLVIGDRKFHDSRKAGLDAFLALRNRLFTGITFGRWEFRLSDSELKTPFLNEFAKSFKAETFVFEVNSRAHYKFALDWSAEHPGNKLFFDVGFLPKIDLLRALPRLEDLQITTPIRYRIGFSDQYVRTTEISADLFFELLGAHQNVHLDNVALTPGELDRTLQIIEEDPTERLIHLGVKRSMLAKWMNGIGITKDMEAGDCSGEFEVVNEMKSRQMIELRYRRASIWIERFDWTSDEQPCHVELQNIPDPMGTMLQQLQQHMHGFLV